MAALMVVRPVQSHRRAPCLGFKAPSCCFEIPSDFIFESVLLKSNVELALGTCSLLSPPRTLKVLPTTHTLHPRPRAVTADAFSPGPGHGHREGQGHKPTVSQRRAKQQCSGPKLAAPERTWGTTATGGQCT